MQKMHRIPKNQKKQKTATKTKYARNAQNCKDCLESPKFRGCHNGQKCRYYRECCLAENAINATMQRVRQMQRKQRN